MAALPSALREARRNGSNGPGELGTITLRLPYREPLHAEALLEFLATRAILGVDEVSDGTYRRGLRLPHGSAVVELTPLPGYVRATLRLLDMRDLAPAVARCRRLFDLDADPVAVDATLGADPALTAIVAKEAGVRVPGAVDGFEIAVRAVIGQQISVAGARKILTRLVAAATPPFVESVTGEAPGCGGSRPRRRSLTHRTRHSGCPPRGGTRSARSRWRSPKAGCISTRVPTASRPRLACSRYRVSDRGPRSTWLCARSAIQMCCFIPISGYGAARRRLTFPPIPGTWPRTPLGLGAVASL